MPTNVHHGRIQEARQPATSGHPVLMGATELKASVPGTSFSAFENMIPSPNHAYCWALPYRRGRLQLTGRAISVHRTIYLRNLLSKEIGGKQPYG